MLNGPFDLMIERAVCVLFHSGCNAYLIGSRALT